MDAMAMQPNRTENQFAFFIFALALHTLLIPRKDSGLHIERGELMPLEAPSYPGGPPQATMTMGWMKNMTLKSFADKELITAGVSTHCLVIFINITLTTMAMLGWPSRSSYDPWWTSSGFCVVDDAHRLLGLPTELLCYLSLTTSALASFGLSKRRSEKMQSNPMLAEFLQTGVFANAAHGFGHAFLWFMGEAAPPLKMTLKMADVANILMLMGFWVGTLRNVVGLTTNHATFMAIAVLGVQYILNVPPELACTYSQSVILLGGSLNQLKRRDDFLKSGNGLLFLATSLYYLPIFALFSLEMFTCSTNVLLSKLGGHVVYDLYLSLVPFILYYVVANEGGYGQSHKIK
ncbi:hypothetical protein ACHAWF_017954 [Thalassiosira exigua]